MPNRSSINQPSRKQLLQYGALACPLAFASTPLYLYAPDFYASEFRVSLSSIAMVLFVLRFIDAFQDPYIGMLTDRYPKLIPPTVIISAITLGLGFTLLFSPSILLSLLPDNLLVKPSETTYLVWFGALLLTTTSAFSFLSILLNSSANHWKHNKDKNVINLKITSYREMYGILGLMIAVSLPTLLQQFVSVPNSFLLLSLTLVFLLSVTLPYFMNWYSTCAIESGQKNKEIGFLPEFTPTTKCFFWIYAINLFASSIPACLVLFFIRDKLMLQELTGGFLLLYFLAAAIGMGIWLRLTKYISIIQAWKCSIVLSCSSFIWAFFLESGNWLEYAIICFSSGFALGADLTIPAALLMNILSREHQQQQAGRYFSGISFLGKSALSLATVLVLPILDYQGFEAAGNNSSQTLWALSFLYALLPCLIKASVFILLLKYSPILESKH